jgi:membrane protein YqaA with SNARE-associated domain
VHSLALIPWLDPENIISAAGPWALLVVCFIVFAETGLLVGFLLPGDTLLVISGLLSHSTPAAPNGIFGINVWWVALLIALAAFVGGEVGYLIGHKGGPAVFERKESGLFSRKNVERTNAFFERYGGLTVILARFVPIVRTFAPSRRASVTCRGAATRSTTSSARCSGASGSRCSATSSGSSPRRVVRRELHRPDPARRRRRHGTRHALALLLRAPQGAQGAGGRRRPRPSSPSPTTRPPDQEALPDRSHARPSRRSP